MPLGNFATSCQPAFAGIGVSGRTIETNVTTASVLLGAPSAMCAPACSHHVGIRPTVVRASADAAAARSCPERHGAVGNDHVRREAFSSKTNSDVPLCDTHTRSTLRGTRRRDGEGMIEN